MTPAELEPTMQLNDEDTDYLGRLVDQLDAVTYTASLPGLPPHVHIEGLTGTIKDVRDKLKAFLVERGFDPWGDE